MKRTLDCCFNEIRCILETFEEFKVHFDDQFTRSKEPLESLLKALKQRFAWFTDDSLTDTSKKADEVVDAGNGIKFISFNSLLTGSNPCLQEYGEIIGSNPNACFVFISSCGPRNSRARESTASSKSLSQLIFESVQKVLNPVATPVTNVTIESVQKVIKASSYGDCYLWIHDKCVGDGSSDAFFSLMSVYQAIGLCDLVITPIESTVAPCWTEDIMTFNAFPCDSWNGITHSLTHSLTNSLTHSLTHPFNRKSKQLLPSTWLHVAGDVSGSQSTSAICDDGGVGQEKPPPDSLRDCVAPSLHMLPTR